MNKEKVDPLNGISDEDLKLIILIHSAFAGASVAAVVEMGGREQLGLPLLVSLACFAIAIPFSLLVVLLLRYRLLERARIGEAERLQIRYWPNSWYIQAFRYVAYTTCFGGFLALFWNYHAIIGLIFLFTSLVAFCIALAAEYYKPRQAISKPAVEGKANPTI